MGRSTQLRGGTWCRVMHIAVSSLSFGRNGLAARAFMPFCMRDAKVAWEAVSLGDRDDATWRRSFFFAL